MLLETSLKITTLLPSRYVWNANSHHSSLTTIKNHVLTVHIHTLILILAKTLQRRYLNFTDK